MLPSRLLLIEDDPQIVRALVPALQVSGLAVSTAGSCLKGLERFNAQAWDAIVVDLGLPDMDGKILVQHVRESSGIPIIVISARHSPGDREASLAAGADFFLNKPFPTPELVRCLLGALQTQGPTGTSQALEN